MRYEHDHEKDVVYFAQTNFRNQMRKFGIKTDDRRRHMYVIGKTGMGKTTLLENMILSDIYAGHGCCYIDPHGDTAEKLINYIPSWRINDVVYFNPSDTDFPIAFNVLEKTETAGLVADYNSLVMSSLLSIFKKIWENVWSARMEYILQNTILALLDTPGTTLLGINRMLSDKDYRTQIISNVKDPVVQQFWLKEFASYDVKFAAEAVAPIQNKIGQFLTSKTMRNIVAQSKSTLNLPSILNDQKIFIVNLSKGRIGEDAMRLLGGMLITKIQMTAMERINIANENDRNDFYLYVDEFQNFAVESFAGILSEARKYRLNIIMAHQYIAQLSEEVRDAVFGNIGSLISFRIGSPDAVFMESEFMPRFLPEDIINLPKYGIYLKLMIDGVTSQPFSATPLPANSQKTESAERVIAQSRERYAGKRQEIEDHVAVWSGFDPNIDVGEALAKVAKEKKEAKKAAFMHEYTCAKCGKLFSLPVELDKSRPIYCDDCHVLIVEERKSKGTPPPRGKQYPPPSIADAVPVVIPTPGATDLTALPPRPIAPIIVPVVAPISVPAAAPIVHQTIVSVPKPVTVLAAKPIVAAASPAVSSSIDGEVPAKKKRRRKKKAPNGATPVVYVHAEPAKDPVASAMSAGTLPTPVAPGERIRFE